MYAFPLFLARSVCCAVSGSCCLVQIVDTVQLGNRSQIGLVAFANGQFVIHGVGRMAGCIGENLHDRFQVAVGSP